MQTLKDVSFIVDKKTQMLIFSPKLTEQTLAITQAPMIINLMQATNA